MIAVSAGHFKLTQQQGDGPWIGYLKVRKKRSEVSEMYWMAIGLALSAVLTYHLTLGLTPKNVNPALSLGLTYVLASVICFSLFIFSKSALSLGEELQKLNWTTALLAIGVVGIEFGFLLAYRVGWSPAIASITVNSVASVLLLLIGWALFKQEVHKAQWLGFALTISGLILLNLYSKK